MARPGLRTHPKFRRLVHLLGEPVPYVLGLLECLWAVAYEAGNALIGDEVDVELACEWPGQRGKLCQMLAVCGFLDSWDGGKFSIHDLFDHAPDYVRKRYMREQQRKERSKPVRRTADTDRRTADNGGQRRTVTAERRTTADNVRPPAPAPAPAPAPFSAAADATAKKTPSPRPRDDLFDALVEVTGADPKLNGSHLGRVCKALRAADPPYTADDVRRLPSAVAGAGLGFTITLGSVEKYISWTRTPPSVPSPPTGRDRQTGRHCEAFGDRLERIQRERKEGECLRIGRPGANGTQPSSP